MYKRQAMFIGNPPGNYDRLLDFSTAKTGSLFFVPTLDMLDDFSSDDEEPEEKPAIKEEKYESDGSLGIGSLK